MTFFGSSPNRKEVILPSPLFTRNRDTNFLTVACPVFKVTDKLTAMREQELRLAVPEPAVDAAVRRLESLAVDELEPGMQLPSEADLAREYGVSRLTIREALKVLGGRGLVEVARGRRATVCDPSSSVLSAHLTVAIRRDPRALLELTEIRQVLEVLAVTLAARKSSRAAMAGVGAALEGMSAAAALGEVEGVEAYHQADVAFHESLALASGNRMLAFILEGLEEALRESFARSFQGHYARGGTMQDVIEDHHAILDRVRAGDAHGAAQAMHAHLRSAERDLKVAMRGTAR